MTSAGRDEFGSMAFRITTGTGSALRIFTTERGHAETNQPRLEGFVVANRRAGS